MTAKNLLDIKTYIDAAEDHGQDSGAEYQIGDLEIMLRAMYKLLTPTQKRTFALDESVAEMMEGTLVDVSEELAALSDEVTAERRSPLGLVEQVCLQHEGRGIFSVGAIAAFLAMRRHWADHLAEGHPTTIMFDDIEGMKAEVSAMTEDLRTLLNQS